MRTSTFGLIPNASKSVSADISLEMFRRMCVVRYFESGVIDSVQKKYIDYLVYLSTGQEAIAAAVSLVIPDFMIFAQHRCHGTYLSFGGDPSKLRDELMGLGTGTSKGKAGSNCIQCHEHGISMYGHHGLIGENVPQGVGAALGSNKPVVCFFGDGSAEEDYVFAAMGFAVTHKLPVMFICEDNDLSILTKKAVRRSWSITEVAKSLGMQAVDITDDPWTVYKTTEQLKTNMPCLMNIYTCRANWHVGVGVDGPPEWDRFKLVKEELGRLGLSEKASEIEKKTELEMKKLWESKQSQKPSKK